MITDEQQAALEKLSQPGNVFLTGPAGTGKSFVLRTWIEQHKGLNLVAASVTSEGALEIGGALLERVLPMPSGVLPPDAAAEDVPAILEKADVFIINDINRLRMDRFNFMINTLGKAKSHARLIVCGDFSCPGPVVDPEEQDALNQYYDDDAENGYAFLAPRWETARFTPVVLKERLRQKSRSFAHALDEMRRGDDMWIHWMNENTTIRHNSPAMFLSDDREEVRKRIEKSLRRLKGKAGQYRASSTGTLPKRLPAEKLLLLKVGEIVVVTTDDRENNMYHRGMMGRVAKLDKDSVTISTIGGAQVRLGRHTWTWNNYEWKDGKVRPFEEASFTQFPLSQGYARLIDDTEGMTLDRIYVDPECSRSGELYLALSRAALGTDIAFVRSKDLRQEFLCNSTDVNVFEEEIIPKQDSDDIVLRDVLAVPEEEDTEAEAEEESPAAADAGEEENDEEKQDRHILADAPVDEPKTFWQKILARPVGAAVVCVVIFAIADVIGSGLATLVIPRIMGK